MSGKFTVILDAGHGGTALADGSTPNNAVGPNGLLEKDLTLKIARIAAARINSNGLRALLTRDDDRNLSLTERARKSRETGADAFVSIHFNGHRNSGIDGTELYVSSGSDKNDFQLADELLKNVSHSASTNGKGVRIADFTVLKSDFHVAKTAACLIEMAYLTNPDQARKLLSPDYLEQLAAAVAESVAAYARNSAYAASLAEETIEKTIAEVTKEHADPKNFPIDLPEPGSGTDTFQISVPPGLKFSRWEVEITATSTGAGYKVMQPPKAGAEGSQQITIEWWHLPYGKINYKFKAYASPDGKSPAAEKIVFDKAGWMEKAKDQISQGLPLKLTVRGEKAKQIFAAMQKYQATHRAQPAGGGVAVAMEPVSITVVVLVGVVIFGILVALGLLTLGAIIKMALDKGYNVKDTKYKAGVGEGQLRQDHEIAFNIAKPETSAGQSFPLGLDEDLDAQYFQPLDSPVSCGNPAVIPARELYKVFKPMLAHTKPNHSKENDFNVLLRWNDIPKNACEIDIVVHFHGYNMPDGATLYRVTELSGLDLTDPTGKTAGRRIVPTLCILPLGKSVPSEKRKDAHFFPFFDADDGLPDLIKDALDYLATSNNLPAGSFQPRRLILTAHSGGGTAIRDILKRRNNGTLKLPSDSSGAKKDIDEVHLFDATYSGAAEVKKWLKDRVAKDYNAAAKTVRPESEMPAKGGALRVVYLPCGPEQRVFKQNEKGKSSCNTSETETEARHIEVELNKLIPPGSYLRRWYRVEQTNVGHNQIPQKYGFQLLTDAGADLKPGPVQPSPKPKCCPAFPACPCRGKPAEQKAQSLGFDYEEPDYFAESETGYENY